MSELVEAVTVRKRRSRGRVIVSVTEAIDQEDLTAKAERYLLLAGDDGDRVEDMKAQLVERAVEEAVKREAPEAFRPGTSVTVRLDSDRDLSVF